LEWYVAADDRWHSPSAETGIARQTTVEGVPVVETRIRIPRGDALQRVYSVADHGGFTLMTVTNESPLPIAVAFTRRDVHTERPIADVAIEGIDLPSTSFVTPVGHQATVTVGLSHCGASPRRLPLLPTADQVVRGWQQQLARAGTLRLPELSLETQLARHRSNLLLDGLDDSDPLVLAHGITELVRLGEPPDRWTLDLASAVQRAARVSSPLSATVFRAARRVFVAAGERRAAADVDRMLRALSADCGPRPAADQPLLAAWLDSQLLTDLAAQRQAVLLPHGVPPNWFGNDFEVHGLPVDTGTLSYAIRWHGTRPAVLWECTVAGTTLRGPGGWSTTSASGEALWALPDAVVANADVSFS
jgi:hypothetical protein